MKRQGKSPVSDPVVIVVVDDLAVRNSLTFSLEIEGFTVHSYATGDELLNSGDLASCSCLVVDQKMPSLNGLDLIAKLRDRHIAAPAILITSKPQSVPAPASGKGRCPDRRKAATRECLLDRIHHAVGHTSD